MPVKYQAVDELAPPWIWTLMVGQPPPCRLPGWVAFEQSVVRTPDGFDYTPAGDRHWAAHGPALRAEAKRHGFEPHWATTQTPTGRGFEL